jgi:hypothetical protein
VETPDGSGPKEGLNLSGIDLNHIYDRLPEVGCILDPPAPIVAMVSRGAQTLALAGVEHSCNPEHPQYGLMNYAWDRMTAAHGPDFDNLTEGVVLPPADDITSSVIWYGERGWQAWKSEADGVPLDSGDTPNYNEGQQLLADRFAPEAVLFYYVYRRIAQWLRMPEDSPHSFDDYLSYWLEEHKQILLNTHDPGVSMIKNMTLQNMEELHQQLLGLPIATSILDHWQVLENTTAFWRTDNDVQKIAKSCAILRLAHLLGTLDRRWQNGKSLFVTWGWQHVYAILQAGILQQFGKADLLTASPADNRAQKPLSWGGVEAIFRGIGCTSLGARD